MSGGPAGRSWFKVTGINVLNMLTPLHSILCTRLHLTPRHGHLGQIWSDELNTVKLGKYRQLSSGHTLTLAQWFLLSTAGWLHCARYIDIIADACNLINEHIII